jgi:acyl-CoA synthetase (AMP-forming)/AMP-acid ligase II
MNVGDFARRQAAARPNSIAFVCGDDLFTWRDVDERSDSLAGAFMDELSPGDRVAIVSRNCHRYWETQFACAKAGLIAVPINSRLVSGELATIFEDATPSALVIGQTDLDKDAWVDLVEKVNPKMLITFGPKVKSARHYEEVCGRGFRPQHVLVGDGDIAVLGFTSGTTGRTKGALLAHRSTTSTALWLATLFGLKAEDTFLACMPAYVNRGGSAGMAPAVVGARTIVMDFEAEAVLETIEAQRVTHLVLAPVMLERLLSCPGIRQRDLSSLRGLWLGGSPASTRNVKEFSEIAGEVVGCLYGMTEATGIAAMRWSIRDEHLLGSVGRCSILVDLELVTADGSEAAVGEPGEIVVRGDSVMLGYWGDPEGSSLSEGWFRTGDIAWRDKDGHLFLVDRRADVINSGGLNVYSAEVEQVISEEVRIVECCVLGAPDEEWGETVCAVVVLSPDTELSLEDLKLHCKSKLATFKLPRRLEVIDELPRNAAGKVDKPALRSMLWNGEQRQISGGYGRRGP